MNELSLVLHVFFVTVLVGPQVLLFLAVTPATWAIEDHDMRTLVLRVIGRRYALLTVIALVALLVTGLYQMYNVTPDPIREEMYRGLGLETISPTVMGANVLYDLLSKDPPAGEEA